MDAKTQSAAQAEVLPPGNSRHLAMLERIEAQKVVDFSNDLDAALKDLQKAFEERREVDEKIDSLKHELQERNWWGALKANFSGKTDKELATMVQGLGASLGLTQNVVSVMLKVLTQKNRVLHAFNDALVDKIAKIQGDTHTLDSNQKKVALHILHELQHHVNEQIRHQELVDSHEIRLSDHDRWRNDKEESDASVAGRVAGIDEQLVDTTNQVSVLKDQAKALVGQTSQLESQWTAVTGRVSALEDHNAVLKSHVAALESRLVNLEGIERAARSPKVVLLRNLIPVASLAIALTALFLSLHS